MDRLTLLIQNRLLLEGVSTYEAPYAAREAIALARSLDITEDAHIVRLATMTRALGATLHGSPGDRRLILAVLQRRQVTPSARLDFIERTWMRVARDAQER